MTAAGANAAAQYLSDGTVRVPDVLFAAATGTFGGWATRLPGWQAPVAMMMMNTGGAAANTMVDNVVYGENKDVGDAIFTSGLGTLSGYKIGNYMEGVSVNPWTINTVGSALSEAVTRTSGDLIDDVKSKVEKKTGNEKK